MNTEMRRADRALGREDTYAVFDAAPFLTVAMHGLDGWPYAVNISFSRVGDTLYFHSAPAGFKVDSLHLDSRVCVTAVAEQEPVAATLSVRYRSAVAFGAVSLITDPEERRAALLSICKKYAADNPEIEKSSAACVSANVYGIQLLEMSGKIHN
jgi:nitroimidazol reductase NimA-like FMN-containing flavoprotein (pyridoxamine 5'-phosphate oxidase superfamily)